MRGHGTALDERRAILSLLALRRGRGRRRVRRLRSLVRIWMPARRDNRWSLGHLLSLHIRDTTRRACHTARYRRLGEAVSVVCGLVRWVLVPLHRACRRLLGEGVAGARGADGRRRCMPVRRRPWAGGDARRPEVIGRDLLEHRWWWRRRRTIRIRPRAALIRRRRCVCARRNLLQAEIYRHGPTGRRLGLAVVAKGLVRVRLHWC